MDDQFQKSVEIELTLKLHQMMDADRDVQLIETLCCENIKVCKKPTEHDGCNWDMKMAISLQSEFSAVEKADVAIVPLLHLWKKRFHFLDHPLQRKKAPHFMLTAFGKESISICMPSLTARLNNTGKSQTKLELPGIGEHRDSDLGQILAEIATETVLAVMLNVFMEKMCLPVLNELPTVVSAWREQIFTMGLGDLGLGPSDNSRGKNLICNYREADVWEDSKKALQVVRIAEKKRN
ncbi:hypothetical protein AAES_33793 [Amazona aestiva]|uniref:Uncharacterized protein n=1 Tax=Amazona aestiva TaxID=12930 RepID=A0A0Q3V2B4_AMAAE|nr:hypothetical protein AAES_33793 [Amazona aestiva]